MRIDQSGLVLADFRHFTGIFLIAEEPFHFLQVT